MTGQKLKTAPPTGGHVFQQIGTTFELNQDIIKTNILTNFELGRDFIGTKLLTKFHEDGTRNQILTDGRTYDGQRPYIIGKNFLTKFPENRTITEKCPAPSVHVFQETVNQSSRNFFIRDIIETNLLTKFHKD
ncbi:hypothetical protein DPMN_150968 [Dreissena polymorpha]|uniref:Uncharacterized protein n=1 Tax=Dreissena polymorpha TaxID=45954 RepID=A0A9D4J6H6_DREPO|nr:hypothetical protein DPMN_150968 [Dreissena polymorpha]